MKIPLYAEADGNSRLVRNNFAVVPAHRWRETDCPIFGTVGPYYTPLQNREAFRFFDPIVGPDAAIYHTAGALGDGERVWIQAKLPGEIRVADDDVTHKFLLLSNSHDGLSSVQIKFTPVRVVCENTLIQALQGEGESIRVAHFRDVKRRLAQARANLKLINTRYARIEEAFKRMVTVKMDDARLTMYLRLVFPDSRRSDDRRATERVRKNRQQAKVFFENGKGNRLKPVAGTLWVAYDGVAEMIDHGPSMRTDDQRLTYEWFGGGASIKVRAFRIAKERMEKEWR